MQRPKCFRDIIVAKGAGLTNGQREISRLRLAAYNHDWCRDADELAFLDELEAENAQDYWERLTDFRRDKLETLL